MEKATIKKQNCQFLVLSMLGVICMSSKKLVNFAEEGDFFWHVKVGEWMVRNRQIMFDDIYSWVSLDKPLEVFSHSWAGSILVYLFYDPFKNSHYPYLGSLIFQTVFFTLLVFTTMYLNKSDILQITDNTVSSILFALIPFFLITGSSGRPYMIGYLCFTVMLWMFKSNRRNPDSKALYFLPVLSCVWANFHGGMAPLVVLFALTNLILSIVTLEVGMVFQKRLLRRQQLKLIYAAIASFCGTLINPYGCRLYTYMFFDNSAAAKFGVIEFDAASIKNCVGIYMMIVFILILVICNKKVSLSLIMPVCATSLFTLIYIRGIDYLIISFCYFIIEYIRIRSKSTVIAKKILILFCLFGSVYCIFLSIINYKKGVAQYYNKEKNLYISDSMIEAIKSAKFNKMYNTYNDGGELIFNDIPVFIDSRADLYPDELLLDGKYFQFLQQNPEEIVTKYQFDGLLIQKDLPLFFYLANVKQYQIIFEDKDRALFTVN